MYSFGPIPSRRLGQSLGINNIPPKHCSYSCIYCQVGKTDNMRIERQAFYDPQAIFEDVQNRIEQILQKEGKIDYLSFVPDGEPTLDLNLGQEIELLKPLGFKIAVFTNASLVWREDVRADLAKADWVSLKVDVVEETTWRKINRPHKHLHLDMILEGMLAFAAEFKGILATETMLVKGINDNDENFQAIAEFLKRLQPSLAYLSIPTRPTAEPDAFAPDEKKIRRGYRILHKPLKQVECLTSENEDEFGFTGQVEEDLLRTTAVHPMTEEAVEKLLKKSHARWDTIHRLIARGELLEMVYKGKRFYIRRSSKEWQGEEDITN